MDDIPIPEEALTYLMDQMNGLADAFHKLYPDAALVIGICVENGENTNYGTLWRYADRQHLCFAATHWAQDLLNSYYAKEET